MTVRSSPLQSKQSDLSQEFQHAVRLYQQGKRDDALSAYNVILALDQAHCDALHLQGVICFQTGGNAEALRSLEAALAVRPDYLPVLSGLALVQVRLGQFAKAVLSYDKILAIDPGNLEALHNRANVINQGHVLTDLKRFSDAIANYEKALTYSPGNTRALHDMGIAYNAKGVALTDVGKLEAAAEAIEVAIKLAPSEAPFFYYSLSVCKRFGPGDHHLHTMQDLAQDMHSFTSDARIALHFGLGKAFTDIAEPERAFEHFMDGNTLKLKQVAYGEATTLGVLNRTQTAFSAELLRNHAGQGDPSSVPIFIIGMPRSGSTLIEQILASHSKVFGAGQIDETEKSIIGLANSVRASASPEALSHLSGDELREFGANYLEGIRSEAPQAERIIDKTLENFPFIGLIHLALPNARFIHTRRDPIETCLSCFSTLFNDNHRPTATTSRSLAAITAPMRR